MAPSALTTAETTTESSLHKTPQINFPVQAEDETSKFLREVNFLGDKEGKVVIRSPPKFSSKEEERQYQKQHLAAVFRVFAKQGFDEGVSGHVSLRDPVNPGS